MSDRSAPFDILGTFADPRSFDTGAAKLVNTRVMFRQQTEGRPGKARLIGVPGLTQISKPENTEVLAMLNSQGTLWAVYKSGNVYRDAHTASPILAGNVNLGGVQYPIVRLAELKTQLAIAVNYDSTGAGGKGTGYIATIAGGVVNQNFQSALNISFDPSAVCVTDNIAVWAGGSNHYAVGQDFRMFASAVGDGGNVNALAFAAKEGRSDPLLDVMTTVRNFFAFGEDSLEMWYNSGASANFPFVPFTNTLIDVGLANRRTLATVHGKLMWVGTDCRIWLGYAQSAQQVSPGWVDLELQKLSNESSLQELTAYMYAQGNDEFYVLTRPGHWSIGTSITNQTWFYIQSNGRPDTARRCVHDDDAIVYVGLDTGEICFVDMTTAQEPAGPLSRTIISPWVGNQTSFHVIDEVTVTSSLGPNAGNFTLDWSEDNFTTSKGTRQITFGQPGTRRAIARQLGSSRRRQIRLQYSGTTAPFEFDEFFGSVSGGT